MAHSRRIRFDGADADYIYFATPSWSRPRSDIEHTITICKRTGEIRCTCEDAKCRRKRGDVQDLDGTNGCKHQRSLLSNYRRLIESEEQDGTED